ncbi:MAG TPA: isochorismatase family cysteine hydrolase [Candidatus Dormibacteraeota bacterium]|nr:isochorismatase family cysteine hydrolase [Candidatus Dormibacteraeota bacterium]
MPEALEKTALLVMDVQPGITDRLNNADEYLKKVKAAVTKAHESHVPVIYVVVGFRPGFPEVNLRNKSFQTVKETMAAHLVDPRPVLTPTGDDMVVVKHRVSAFSGSDLEVLLRAQGIQHLVLAGIATSGVVLSTIREAADKDFRLTVLSDLCADFDAEVHSILLEKVFPRQATVITSEQWVHMKKGE